eukprot:XP_001696399.1 predicted protein [Chlamydomonas reinhardtii]
MPQSNTAPRLMMDRRILIGSVGLCPAAVPTPKADENHQAAASIQAPPYQAEPVLAGATIAAIAQAATAKAMSTDEQLYIDAPWWEYLAPFAWLWVPFQCLVGINIGLLAASVKSNKAYDQCIQWFLECRNASATSFIFHIVMLVAEVSSPRGPGPGRTDSVFPAFESAGVCNCVLHPLSSGILIPQVQLNIYLSVEVRIRGVTLLYIVANDIVQSDFSLIAVRAMPWALLGLFPIILHRCYPRVFPLRARFCPVLPPRN